MRRLLGGLLGGLVDALDEVARVALAVVARLRLVARTTRRRTAHRVADGLDGLLRLLLVAALPTRHARVGALLAAGGQVVEAAGGGLVCD